MSDFEFLVSGFDTIECAYYMTPTDKFSLDFVDLGVQKEQLSKNTNSKKIAVQLGCESFMLAPHGTKSGYPFLIENDVFIIQFGEFNRPNFYVKYRSISLWHHGAAALHNRFLRWAESIGMMPYQPERISRVDYAFDYYLPDIDFDENSFISRSAKDNQHRKNGKIQTLKFGTENVVLRVYNKVDEINEVSQKTWLFDIWGRDQDVWRIEWQVRKDYLRLLGITSFSSLIERQGDLLRLLCKDHTTLRTKTADSNRSRWPTHPLWVDLINRVNQFEGLGVVREWDEKALLEERLTRIAISVYGYVKRVAAIDALYTGNLEKSYMDEAMTHLQNRIFEIHDQLTWQQDVNRRINEMRLGDW